MSKNNIQEPEHNTLHYVQAGVRFAATNAATFVLGATIGSFFGILIGEEHQYSQLEKLLLAGVGTSLLNLDLASRHKYTLTQSLTKAPEYSVGYAAGIYVGLGMANWMKRQ